MPGKSHQEKIMIPAKYPYLLNGYPKIIHLDSQYSKDEISNKLKEFCQKNTRGEVLVVLRSEISNNEIEDLFSISGLNLLDKKPYNSYLAKPTGEKSLAEILSSLEINPQFGRMETDCSLSLIN
jgi:hypothetical protein